MPNIKKTVTEIRRDLKRRLHLLTPDAFNIASRLADHIFKKTRTTRHITCIRRCLKKKIIPVGFRIKFTASSANDLRVNSITTTFSRQLMQTTLQSLKMRQAKSLYTVIPKDSGLQALAYFLNKRPVFKPPTSTLTHLAELILTLNAFSFNQQYCRQVSGVAMGSRMGRNYACLFVGYMEERTLTTYTGFIPQLYKRYIDDIVGAASCRRDKLEGFITQVSTFHPALQFTYTVSQTQIPFLDITLSVSGSRISTSVHYKDTDTHNYLHYTSSHHTHCKIGIPYFQFLRLRRLYSEDDDVLQKCQEMSTFFRKPWLSLGFSADRSEKRYPPSPAKRRSRNVCVKTTP